MKTNELNTYLPSLRNENSAWAFMPGSAQTAQNNCKVLSPKYHTHLTRVIAANNKWLLVDVYMDIASSKTGSSRKDAWKGVRSL